MFELQPGTPQPRRSRTRPRGRPSPPPGPRGVRRGRRRGHRRSANAADAALAPDRSRRPARAPVRRSRRTSQRAARRHLHLPGLRERARRHPPPLPELRDDARGRLQRRAVRPPEPRPAGPARELPALPRQPARDGARARHQLPDRPVPRRGARSRPRVRATGRRPTSADEPAADPAAGRAAARRSSRPWPATR